MSSLDRRAFMALSAGSLLSLRLSPDPKPTPPPAAGVKTGGVRLIPIDGGRYKVWTKRLGAGPIKVLTLHGGPGFTHEYFECFEDFLPQAGVEFWYYDQLGSFYSDQPEDKSLWTIERFRDEVEQVRQALGLEDFILYGQSWGSMLAIDYALKYQRHLKGLVLSSMTASIASYVEYVNRLKAALPPDVKAVLEKYEAKGDFDNPEYQKAMFQEVYGRHVCRLDPWPDPVARAFKHFNPQVYNTMQGPNEFVVTGTFKDWDRWKDLPKITVPTLVIGARYDEMNPEDIRKMGRLLPRSRTVVLENGSHLAMWDDQEAYFRALIPFLQDVQAGRFPPAS
ncbi:MAG TPA: proline iminopeptidase-family hydrolase [Thermoanaerobaculia bacterium]|nr:proline iminopeptidase-family hydrolase [Thermoanaerobaculia bacterium]